MKNIIAIFVLVASCSSYADDNLRGCSEHVKRIHIHQNGNIYFNTDTVCAGSWCLIDWEDQNQVNRAYSAMLAAVATNSEMTFVWSADDVASCDTSITEPHISPKWIDVM